MNTGSQPELNTARQGGAELNASGEPKEKQTKKPNPIEFCRKYKFEIAVIAAAVICVVSMIAAGIIIFSDEDDDVPRRDTEEIVTRVGKKRFADASEEADIALSWTAKELRLDGIEAYEKISAEVYPVGYKNQRITWRSSNETIAKIDAYGNIIAYAPGEVILEAYHEETGKTKDALLKIIRPVTGIFMPATELKMNIGDAPAALEVWLTPNDASVEDIKWTSKDASIAEVDQLGRVKAVGAGMTEIIASNSAGDAQGKCFVTVVNQTVNVNEVEIQNKENNRIGLGDFLSAVATVLPNNAKNKTLVWSSSDEKIATVNANGTIRALGVGTATITASAPGGAADSIDITVTEGNGDDLDLGNSFIDGFGLLSDLPLDGSGEIRYEPYDITIDDMVNIQMASNPPPQIWINGASVDATVEETADYLNPNSFYAGAYKYQFLDLSRANGISEDALNAFLEDKGILRGQAAAFISAARDFGISEVYLAAHACLETGNGTSQLATGVEVNGETVYNMFGIAAYDSSALYSGSQYAYSAGWTSVEAAIRGGAEWISTWYINSADGRQNTLYKMRWNPERPSEHQYATDIGWAVKQASSIEKMFASFPEAVLSYEIPVYNGMIPPVIEQ